MPYDNELFKAQFGIPGGGPPSSGIQGPAEGFWGTLEYLNRPQYAVSEAVQAGLEGEGIEGIGAGVWRGLQGERKFGPLGERLFPEAAKPGFQTEDIPAFAVDVLTDPLMFMGHGALKKVMKIPAAGILKGVESLLPEVKAVVETHPEKWYLPEVLGGLKKSEKVAYLSEELKALNMSPLEAAKRVLISKPLEEMPDSVKAMHNLGISKYRDLYAGMPVEDIYKHVGSEAAQHAETARGFIKSLRETADKTTRQVLSEMADDQVDLVFAGIRSIDANFQPVAKTALQSLAQEVAAKWMPVRTALGSFGGVPGEKMAAGYDNAMLRMRLRLGHYESQLADILRGVSESDQLHAVAVLEGKASPKNETAARVAQGLRGLLDEHWKDMVSPQNLDPMGQMIKVVDSRSGEVSDLVKNRIENYFPHKFPAEWYTQRGQKKLREKLLAQGFDETRVDKFIRDRLAYKPKKVGHIELVRQAGEELDLMYEKNPAKVLPAYFRDSIFRQEMSKEFGVNGELLETWAGDLKKIMATPAGRPRVEWIDRVVDAMQGKDLHDTLMEEIAKHVSGIQAITKLGVSTTVANFGQSPLNQIVRNGFTNYAKSLWLGGVPAPNSPLILGATKDGLKSLGMAAYNRGMMEDIIRATTGGRSWWADMYMRGIGFNYSERFGRHAGAVGGWLDAENLWKQYLTASKEGHGTLASRAAAELSRKYDISPKVLQAMRGDEALTQDVLERAALRGSDAVMHAFDVMDLPIGWRDPFWRLVLQFKSFGYQQLGFMGREVLQPALQYWASGGAAGNIAPLYRSMLMFPAIGMGVSHARDLAKGIPHQILWGEWDYKDPYWADPDPGSRFLTDMGYVGTLGLMGDAIEQAQRGKLASWLVGPTAADIIDTSEKVVGGSFDPGREAGALLPGTLAFRRGEDIKLPFVEGQIPFTNTDLKDIF